MPFHLEEQDDEDQLGSMDRISGKKWYCVKRRELKRRTCLKYLIQSVGKSIFISGSSTHNSPIIDD